LLIFSIINFTTPSTNALFSDNKEAKSNFRAGTWWDKSSLKFAKEFGSDCTSIFSFIENNGTGDMAIDSKFYVYYSPLGNPVNPKGINGELVYEEGVIPKMKSKSSPIKISFKPNKYGFYKFVAFQHPNKPGENGNSLTIDGTPVTFSEVIEFKVCNKDK